MTAEILTIENYIGKRVRELRGTQSLRAFGKKCGVTYAAIDMLEKGVNPRTGKPVNVTLNTLQKIAASCGVSVTTFLEE